MLKKLTVGVLSLVAMIGLGYWFMTGVGKPVSTDLSVIGQGKPVLVLVFESYTPLGAESLDLIRQVRADYDSRVDFVVADLGVPEGRAFAKRYQLNNGQALFLKQDGEPFRATNIPGDEQALRDQLDAKLGAVE